MAVDILKARRDHIEIGDLAAERGHAGKQGQLFRLRAGKTQEPVCARNRLGKGRRQRRRVAGSGANEK
ncbi:hypothetical protein AB3G45_01900 [Shinella sp. S4-D37]|uniref:hypothetical protein n=1 Tax=Shinella sp. S4-D37 TaxID=3161999 RepID=UPI00346738E4